MDQFKIKYWSDQYDAEKYPTTVYDEVVVKGSLTAKTMLVMGAWKTGNLTKDLNGKDYIDEMGIKYTYKDKWTTNPMAHYIGWKSIQDNFVELKTQVPLTCPQLQPDVINQLREYRGIGFVYAIFFMHCCEPKEYPLYDQHVYRAYKYDQTNRSKLTSQASDSWDDYIQYKKYFNLLVINSGEEFYIVDRALWTFGKHLKRSGNHEKLVRDIADNQQAKYGKQISTLTSVERNIEYEKTDDTYFIKWSKLGFSIKQSQIDLLLSEYFREKEQWYPLGASETNPISNGMGKYLAATFPSLTPRHASCIAAILVDNNLLEAKGIKPVWLRKK